jgi:hypothetical protein
MWQGPQPGDVVPPLHPEIAAVLIRFAEDALTVDRARRMFHAFDAFGTSGLEVQMPSGSSMEVAEQDIQTLAESGYIRATNFNTSGTFDFYVTESGFVAAAELGGAPDTFQHAEESVLRVLDDEDFRARHPDAYARWQSAARLSAEDPVGNATKIGHDCREAMQFFATSMLAQAGVDSDDPPDKTVSRMRAVLDARRDGLGDKEAAFLDALLSYWGTVSDLAQRQEHGAQKPGQPLHAIDSGRLVLQTAVVMFEIDRALA